MDERENQRRQGQKLLESLLGKPLQTAFRYQETELFCFGFGNMLETLNSKGEPLAVPEICLHAQCTFHIIPRDDPQSATVIDGNSSTMAFAAAVEPLIGQTVNQISLTNIRDLILRIGDTYLIFYAWDFPDNADDESWRVLFANQPNHLVVAHNWMELPTESCGNSNAVRQFVMAYSVEQDRLRAMLPEGFTSLRPVLRINAEERAGSAYVELNTPVEKDGVRGWLNIAAWDDAKVTCRAKGTAFVTDELEIIFAPTGVQGGCPAEQDNAGCWYGTDFRPAETITVNKEFCDCVFQWKAGTGGKSIGKTLPAIPTEPVKTYPRQELTVQNAAVIPCQQVLGSYMVCFARNSSDSKI